MVKSRSLIVFLLLFAAPLKIAYAKTFYSEMGNCTSENYKEAVANIARAKALEHDGKYQQSYITLNDTSCAWATDDEKASSRHEEEIQAIRKRLYKELGDEAEKKEQFKEAFDWYSHDEESYIKDAERVMVKMAKAKPDDLDTIATAYHFLNSRHMTDSLKALSAVVMQHVRPLLANEEKQFASRQGLDKDSFETLKIAQNWLAYAQSPENNTAHERAEKRGDTLAVETSSYFLEMAINYYTLANKPLKVQSVHNRAKKLGDEAKSKGENERAIEYYKIAEQLDQANTLQKTTEASQRISEGKRQQQFKKDQDKLEKELGF